MADKSNKTEQPTPRRLEKARKEGQFPVSKELISGFTLLCFWWLASSRADDIARSAKTLLRDMISAAFQPSFTPSVALERFWWRYGVWIALLGATVAILATGAQLMATGLGLAWNKLAPDLTRLNPMPRLKEMISRNISSSVEALVLLVLFTAVLGHAIQSELPVLAAMARMPLGTAFRESWSILNGLMWRAVWLVVIVGIFDWLRQKRRWMNQMKMSKQEVREEVKESEGNPQTKMRIRRLQRELLRRRMMQQVPKATAVIVNPTHFAVALSYQMNESGAPKVVAKGKNWLALRIREVAIRNQVPVIENAPLAQALYKSVDVGQEIPPHLYQAVAEVLAYIFRLLRGRQSGH